MLFVQVLWYKDTMKLIEGERIHTEHIGNTYKLSITTVTERDFGKYFCKASNLLEKEISQVVHLTGSFVCLSKTRGTTNCNFNEQVLHQCQY